MRKKAKRRQRDLVAEFDQASADATASFRIDPKATYEQNMARAVDFTERQRTAIDRMHAALKARGDGFARAEGIARKKAPPSKSRVLCDQLSKRFPREIRQFTAGEPITDARLREMLDAVGARKMKTDTVRRQLARQFRDGQKRAEAHRRARGGRQLAKRLDVRHGVIQTPPPLDVTELFPGLKMITRVRDK